MSSSMIFFCDVFCPIVYGSHGFLQCFIYKLCYNNEETQAWSKIWQRKLLKTVVMLSKYMWRLKFNFLIVKNNGMNSYLPLKVGGPEIPDYLFDLTYFISKIIYFSFNRLIFFKQSCWHKYSPVFVLAALFFLVKNSELR